MKKGNIIFLLGTSSAGKTSLAKQLQVMNEESYFHLELDVFENMAPEAHLEKSYWPTLAKSASAMHHCIATFSDLGFHVIVDHVILDIPQEAGWLEECVLALHMYPVLFVGVHCSLHELERREQARGDRDIGQAKWQLDKVHRHGVYDVEVNTHDRTLAECADEIMRKLQDLNPATCAFHTLYNRMA